jgi:hypothetical protein
MAQNDRSPRHTRNRLQRSQTGIRQQARTRGAARNCQGDSRAAVSILRRVSLHQGLDDLRPHLHFGQGASHPGWGPPLQIEGAVVSP